MRSFLYTYGVLMELSMEHFVRNQLVTLWKYPSALQKTNKIASFCYFFSVAYPKRLVTVSTIQKTNSSPFPMPYVINYTSTQILLCFMTFLLPLFWVVTVFFCSRNHGIILRVTRPLFMGLGTRLGFTIVCKFMAETRYVRKRSKLINS